MTKLSERTQIANNAISRALKLHLVKLGTPNTSWKADISQIVPGFGANFIYVSKDGNDDIAAVAPYMPFATFAAARTYLLTLSPTVTNRPLLTCLQGYYEEGIQLVNNCDYNLGNSVLELKAGSLATIDDNNVACNCNIYGNATIIRSTAGTFKYGLRTQNAGTNLTIYSKEISSTLDIGVRCTNGNVNIFSKISNSVIGNKECVRHENGNVNINGNVTSVDGLAIWSSGGTLVINGDSTSYERTAVLCSGGNVTINGNCYSIPTTPDAIDFGCFLMSGTLTLNNSRISTTGTDAHAIQKIGGTLIVNGCILIANGAGYGIYSGTPQDVLVYGTSVSNKAIEANVTTKVGTIIVDTVNII